MRSLHAAATTSPQRGPAPEDMAWSARMERWAGHRIEDAARRLAVPALGTLAALAAGLAGHAATPWLAEVPLVVGAGLIVAVWRVAPGGPERLTVLPLLATGAPMVAATWALGSSPPVLVVWLVAAGGWSGLWLGYGSLVDREDGSPKVQSDGNVYPSRAQIRARTRADAPGAGQSDGDRTRLGRWLEAVAWWVRDAWTGYLRRAEEPVRPAEVAASLVAAVDAWPDHADHVGLPGLALTLLAEDDYEAHFVAELPSRFSLQDVASRLPRIAVAFSLALRGTGVKVSPDALRVERDPAEAHRCHVYLTLRSPLDPPRLYPGQSGSRWADPARIAFAGGSETLSLALDERNVLVLGIKGSGKTLALAGLVVEKATPDVAFFAIEVGKGGADFRKLSPRLEALATTAEQARDLLHMLERLRMNRAARFAAEGMHQWPTSPTAPHIVLVVDELAALLERVPEAEKLLAGIGNRGRQQGISLWLANQRAVGEAWVGAFCDVRLCFRVGLETDARAVLGSLVQEGWNPIGGLPLQGSFLAYVPGEREVNRPWRAWDFGPGGRDLPRWAAQLAATKPDMSAEIAAAMPPATGQPGTPERPPTKAERIAALLADARPDGLKLADLEAATQSFMARSTLNGLLKAHHESRDGRWHHRGGGEGK